MMKQKQSYKKLMNDLAREGALRGITEEESTRLKEILLDAYTDILTVCNNHELSLFLVGGSLLGAVRHQGFIPWDDDLDVAMSRSDFTVFKEIFNDELGEKYILNSPNYSDDPIGRFPKILIKNTKMIELGMSEDDENTNIKIDLFLIENVPANSLVRKLHGVICSGYMYIASNVELYEKRKRLKPFMCTTSKGAAAYRKKASIGRIFSVIDSKKWFAIVDKACQYKRETGLIGIPTGRKHYFGEIRKKETFFPARTKDFEGRKAVVPNDWDDYLTNLYGKYMEIPKIEDREKHLIYAVSFDEHEESR